MAIKIATVNIDWPGNPTSWARIIKQATDRADLVCVQEAKNTRVSNYAPPGWDTYQVTNQGKPKAGSALMWNQKLRRIRTGHTIGLNVAEGGGSNPRPSARQVPEARPRPAIPATASRIVHDDPPEVQAAARAAAPEPKFVNASLAGRPFRLNPTSIDWSFSSQVADLATVGGKVIQVFGTQMGDLTIEGTFGAGGWQEQEEFLKWMKEVGDRSVSNPTASPPHFRYPSRGWDLLVYLKKYSTPDGGRSIVLDNQIVAPRWTLVLHIVEDNSGLKKIAQDAYLARISQGIGWKQTKFNGPMGTVQEATGGQSIKEYLASEFGVGAGMPTGNQDSSGSGISGSNGGPPGGVVANDLMDRWIAWGDFEVVATGKRITAASLHMPPIRVRSVAYAPYADNVVKFIQDATYPVVIGADWNWQVDDDPGGIGRRTGMKFRGFSIDGIGSMPGIPTSNVNRFDINVNHHRGVVATLAI